MSLPAKKGRDPSQLPTLSYEIKLNLPNNVDSNPQEISFLDLIANDTKFKNDKESLELVLSSYVKACGKQSVKEILVEHDNMVEDNASLSNIIRALMDYNDQQNANLGVGYNDPEDDDSFIDDSTAAQDIIPKNMTNERDGFYVNEKHQPIQAKYLSESSDSENSDEEESDESDDDDDDDDNESSESEKEDKQTKKINQNENDLNEKVVKKSKLDEDLTVKVANAKRKRSISEVSAPSLSINHEEKTKSIKTVDEPVKKLKKLSETTDEISAQNLLSYVLPNEMDNDIKPSIEKLVKLISLDQTITHSSKKIERLYDTNLSRELLDLVKKLHRHTNAHRQLVFDILSTKTGLCTPILITRARLLLLNDYEPSNALFTLNDLKDKLKMEINRSLEFHIQAHNQAIKEWQQKMLDNPSKDKNRGPRKNFRLHKTINELIIRCIDRQLEKMTILDLDSLELFLHDHIVSLWEKPGWMTAKKIISEVIRLEYRPLRDPNLSSSTQIVQTNRVIPTVEQVKKDSPVVPTSSTKLLNPNPSPTNNPPKISQPQNLKTTEIKSPNNNQGKSIEMATRVSSSNPVKQPTIRPTSTESTITNQLPEQLYSKTVKTEVIRPIAKPAVISPSSQSDSSVKRHSTPNLSLSAVDLPLDLYSQYKKHVTEVTKVPSQSSSSSTKDQSSSSSSSSSSQRPSSLSTTSTSNTKQQFATKLPTEKTPAGSFLKDALSGSSSPKVTTSTPSPKLPPSSLTVDSMLSKTHQSPKQNTNSTTMKPPTTIQSPNNNQRSSSSQKTTTTTTTTTNTTTATVNRSSNDSSHSQIQQSKPSSSSNRPPSNSSSSSSSNRLPSNSSSSSSSASRRSAPGFSSTHEQQSNRSHSSQLTIPPSLSQTLQWDSATLQLAAAALANPQLLSSTVFDPALFNSMFASAANIVSNSQSPSSSSRQQHSQNPNNNRRT